jgi:hypothetical protein
MTYNPGTLCRDLRIVDIYVDTLNVQAEVGTSGDSRYKRCQGCDVRRDLGRQSVRRLRHKMTEL